MFSVTRSQRIARLAKRSDALSHEDIEAAVEMRIEHLAAPLAGAGRIEVRGFGAFSVRPRRGAVHLPKQKSPPWRLAWVERDLRRLLAAGRRSAAR